MGAAADSEVVRRGGEAFVLQGLLLADGKKFVRLTKDKYAVLSQLLVPASQRKELFAKTRLFEHIAALRDATMKKLTKETMDANLEASDDDGAASGQDPTALLGFDAPERLSLAQSCRVLRMKERSAQAQLPATAPVSYTPSAGGEPWAFVVALEGGKAHRKNAAIELIASNLERLRGFLAMEIATLAAASGSHASAPEVEAVEARRRAKKEPRGTPGNREYFIESKNMWVRKRLLQGGKDGVRKYRTLYRRPTDPEMPAALAVPVCEEGASGGGEGSVSEEGASGGGEGSVSEVDAVADIVF